MVGSGRAGASPIYSGLPVAVVATTPAALTSSVAIYVTSTVARAVASLPINSRGHTGVAIVASGPAELRVATGKLLEAGPVEVVGGVS